MKSKRFIIIRLFTKLKGKIYSFHPPLNLAILATYIGEGGIETRIFDYESEYYDKNTLLNRIKSYSPAAVGLTAYTNTVNNAHIIAGDIKKEFPELPLIIGARIQLQYHAKRLRNSRSLTSLLSEKERKLFYAF